MIIMPVIPPLPKFNTPRENAAAAETSFTTVHLIFALGVSTLLNVVLIVQLLAK